MGVGVGVGVGVGSTGVGPEVTGAAQAVTPALALALLDTLFGPTTTSAVSVRP